MALGGNEWMRKESAFLGERQEENGGAPSENDPWGQEWQASVEEEAPFAGDKSETDNNPEAELERKRQELETVKLALRDEVKERIGDVHGGDGDGRDMKRRLADGCMDSLKGDPDQREKALAMAKAAGDFMFLEESRIWLRKGSEAEKRLTELFHETYVAPAKREEDGGVDVGDMAMEHGGGLAEHTTKVEAGQELSPRLQEIKDVGALQEYDVPALQDDEDDNNKAGISVDARRKDFVAFAKKRLGGDSEEYRLILEEAYRRGRYTDKDLEEKPRFRPGQEPEYYDFCDSLDLENQGELSKYMSSLGGFDVPMRLATSLTTPFGERT